MTKAKTTVRNATNSDDSDQLYTFDDIPKYCRVYHMGKLGWVVAKGGDLKRGSGKHLRIQYKEETRVGRKTITLHERVVNRWLGKRDHLWVDFGRHLEKETREVRED